MSDKPFRYPIWVRGDLDGFFGLMVDNLVQVLTIFALCALYCGMPVTVVTTRMLPGVAISLLIGNLFYGIQAHYVARKYRRPDTTALPYGINTPSLFAFVFFVMMPVYHGFKDELGDAGAADLAWKAGMLACLVSGVIEFCGAFVAERLRRVTPRAALLGVLSGLAIAFIASDFAFRIYTKPLVGLLPLGILLLAYFGRFRFPLGLPGGLLVVVFGTVIAWGTSALGLDWFGGVKMSAASLGDALGRDAVSGSVNFSNIHWIQPIFRGDELLSVLSRTELLIPFLTVSVPMGVINALGSLQNIESAEAAGDKYATAPSLAVNGIGTIAAGLFGSCFPTTIYIGHPAWKSMGAKAGYSILNGLFFTLLFLFGCGEFLGGFIPIEAGAAIVMYIGIIMTAQAFQATPRAHAPAVAIALFPPLAALLAVNLPLFMADAHSASTVADMAANCGPASHVPTLPGILALFGANAGWMVSSLVLAAIGVALVEKRYRVAAIWSGAATVLTLIGLLHSYRVQGNVVREYFIWQGWQRAADTAQADEPPPAAPATAPAGSPSATAAAAQKKSPTVFTYRASPVAVGYGLATVVFVLAALRSNGRGRETGAYDPGSGSGRTEHAPPLTAGRPAEGPPPISLEIEPPASPGAGPGSGRPPAEPE